MKKKTNTEETNDWTRPANPTVRVWFAQSLQFWFTRRRPSTSFFVVLYLLKNPLSYYFKMMLRQTVMRSVRAVRQVRYIADWQALQGKTSTDAARSDVARLRDLHGEINAEEKKFGGEPAAIDFDSYRASISSPGIVDEFEKAYNGLAFPTYPNESAPESMAAFDAILESAASTTDASAARLAELESMIAEAETSKTTADTTVEEVLNRYPEIAKEIDEEVEQHLWWKDV